MISKLITTSRYSFNILTYVAPTTNRSCVSSTRILPFERNLTQSRQKKNNQYSSMTQKITYDTSCASYGVSHDLINPCLQTFPFITKLVLVNSSLHAHLSMSFVMSFVNVTCQCHLSCHLQCCLSCHLSMSFAMLFVNVICHVICQCHLSCYLSMLFVNVICQCHLPCHLSMSFVMSFVNIICLVICQCHLSKSFVMSFVMFMRVSNYISLDRISMYVQLFITRQLCLLHAND